MEREGKVIRFRRYQEKGRIREGREERKGREGKVIKFKGYQGKGRAKMEG